MFTVLDIAYTGGNYRRDSIVEIALLRHDGQRITDEWYSTIRPTQELSDFVLAMLHLPRHQIERAPDFATLAPYIADFCANTVLVGIQIRLLYALLLQAYRTSDYKFKHKQICLSKLIAQKFGTLPEMTLSGVCNHYHIPFDNHYTLLQRTRSIAAVFEHLYLAQQPQLDKRLIRQTTATVKYPAQLPADKIDSLPNAVGVYYFSGKRGQMLYLGKSNDIKKRVMTHFADDLHSADKRQLKREVCDIQYRLTGSELVALLLESDEIKRYMPAFNRAQRRKVYTHAIYGYTDDDGYACLRPSPLLAPPNEPIVRFASKWQAVSFLWYAAARYQLDPQRCGIATYEKWLLHQYPHSSAHTDTPNADEQAIADTTMPNNLPDALSKHAATAINDSLSTTSSEPQSVYEYIATDPATYNERVAQLVAHYSYPHPNMLIIDKGRNADECAVVWIDANQYKGYAYLPHERVGVMSCLENYLIPMRENPDVQSIIRAYLRRHTDKLRIMVL